MINSPNGPSAGNWPPRSLLGRVTPATANTLLSLGVRRVYPTGSRLINEGGTDRHAFLLLTGWVKVLAYDETGHDALLAIRTGGDLIGEMAALGGQPRSATVLTASEVSARLIVQSELTRFLSEHSDVALDVVAVVSDRLRWANQRRIDFKAASAPSRVCRVLGELVYVFRRPGDTRRTPVVRITQPELASLAGVSINTVEKTLRQLSDEGHISRRYGQIVVLDSSGLRSFARRTENKP